MDILMWLVKSNLDDGGWGNGYVAVPLDHSWYLDYCEYGHDYGYVPTIPTDYEEVTYTGVQDINGVSMFVIGFDTGHIHNNPDDHDFDYVWNVTKTFYDHALAVKPSKFRWLKRLLLSAGRRLNW